VLARKSLGTRVKKRISLAEILPQRWQRRGETSFSTVTSMYTRPHSIRSKVDTVRSDQRSTQAWIDLPRNREARTGMSNATSLPKRPVRENWHHNHPGYMRSTDAQCRPAAPMATRLNLVNGIQERNYEKTPRKSDRLGLVVIR